MQQLFVVKIGGNVIDDARATGQFLTLFASLPGRKILVHGGGKVATQMAARLGVETQMVEGRRITDGAMLEVVTMVYGGLVNKTLVARLQANGCNAMGLTGADAGSILARKREGWAVDYGYAGDIVRVNAEVLQKLLEGQFVPVFAPLTADADGQLLNTNADTMASALATALASTYRVSLVYCFEKKGVLADPADDDSVIPHISFQQYGQLKTNGVVSKGMVPKLDNAFSALRGGVAEVFICQAEALRSLAEGHAHSGTRLTVA
jgi:acetylglutamate kinase